MNKEANQANKGSVESDRFRPFGFLTVIVRMIDDIGQGHFLRPKDRRRLVIVNRMISLFALCMIIRQVLLLTLDAGGILQDLAGISLLGFCLLVLLLNASGRFFWAKILIAYGPPPLMTGWLLYIYGHDPADTWMTITGFMMICLILFGKREKGIMLGALVNGMACMFALALLPRFFSLPRKSEVSEGLQFMVDWFFSPVIFCFLSGVAWMIYRDSLKAEARADQLLLNVLPKSIAERLKEGEDYIADRFSGVSIIFVDVANFTNMSSRLEPNEVVRILDSVFRRFDSVSETYGAEKIKTIGDGYMAATGVPKTDPEHARNAALTALAFRRCAEESARELGLELGIRVGIHSGPVVAGVIGTKKFIYDMWGDTVNVASRMESHSQVGKIQVSGTFRDELGDDFEFSESREIEIKGKGPMETCFLLREKAND